MINLKTIQKLWDESDTPMPSKWNELFQVSEQLLKERDAALEQLKEARVIERKNFDQFLLDKKEWQEKLKQAEEKAVAYREVAKVVCPGCGGIGWHSKANHAPGCDGERCQHCPVEEQVKCDCCGAVDAEAQRILEQRNQSKERSV